MSCAETKGPHTGFPLMTSFTFCFLENGLRVIMGELETDNVKLIVNNILCYISTSRHSMRVDDTVKSCFAFFHIDDIMKGKDLLCDIVGERPIRRRNENRILHELQDITDLFNKCDEESKKLPTFVANSFNVLPPLSGFELVADHIMKLNEEILALSKEVEALREARLYENTYSQINMIIQEDLLLIK